MDDGKYLAIVFRCHGCGYTTMERARMTRHMTCKKCKNTWATKRVVWCDVLSRRPLATTFVAADKDPRADAVVYRCAKCKYPTMEWKRAQGHARIKRCRDECVLREHVAWRDVVSSEPFGDPKQETNENGDPGNGDIFRVRKVATIFKDTVKFDDLGPRTPDAAWFSHADPVDVALTIFRNLWGSDAPPEFRSVGFSNRRIWVSGSGGVRRYETLEQKNQCIVQFLRLIRDVGGCDEAFCEYMDASPTFEDVLTRNDVYERTRHTSSDRVAAAKRFKREFFGAL